MNSYSSDPLSSNWLGTTGPDYSSFESSLPDTFSYNMPSYDSIELGGLDTSISMPSSSGSANNLNNDVSNFFNADGSLNKVKLQNATPEQIKRVQQTVEIDHMSKSSEKSSGWNTFLLHGLGPAVGLVGIGAGLWQGERDASRQERIADKSFEKQKDWWKEQFGIERQANQEDTAAARAQARDDRLWSRKYYAGGFDYDSSNPYAMTGVVGGSSSSSKSYNPVNPFKSK